MNATSMVVVLTMTAAWPRASLAQHWIASSTFPDSRQSSLQQGFSNGFGDVTKPEKREMLQPMHAKDQHDVRD
jgi:hypothetical protein